MAYLSRVNFRPRIASHYGVAARVLSLRFARLSTLLQDGRLRSIPHLIAAIGIVALLPIDKKQLPWVFMIVFALTYPVFYAARVGVVGWRVRPFMDMHGYVSRGGRKEVRQVVSSMDPRADAEELALIAEVNRQAREIVASDFWRSERMARCRDRLDPFEVLRHTAIELRDGAPPDQVAMQVARPDDLKVIASAVTKLDKAKRRGPLLSVLGEVPLPARISTSASESAPSSALASASAAATTHSSETATASAGPGSGLDIDPVLTWADGVLALTRDVVVSKVIGREFRSD